MFCRTDISLSNTSFIKLIFTSDWSGTDLGFIIKCSAVKIHHGETTETHERECIIFFHNLFS